MHAEWLTPLLIFLAAAVIAVPLFQRLGLGAVMGYLVAGCVIGPQGLGLWKDTEAVQHISELGIVLLLFIIGLELVPQRLWQMRTQVFGWGSVQMLLTGLLLTLLLWTLNFRPGGAWVAGFGLAMSSTAMALQLLTERNELTSAHGRLAFAILLLQDLTVIPLLALLPLAGEAAVTNATPAGQRVLLLAATLAMVLIGGRYLLRPWLRRVAAARSRELFTASALLLVLGVAALMSAVGLSMALGAFVAGVLLADSEFRHELESDIEPFKGLLLGLFFISVGMNLDLATLYSAWPAVLGGVSVLMAAKGLVIYALGRRARLAPPAARALALSLSQGGEFAFVLFGLAVAHQALSAQEAAPLSLIVGLSMAATPLLRQVNDRWIEPRLAREAPRDFDRLPEEAVPVIIAGFGRIGQIIARVLRLQNIPFTALDRDPTHIQFVSRFGNQVYYGDATRLDLLQAARVDKARLFVLAIADIEASVRIAQLLREGYPELKIFARASNREHAYRLLNTGVHYVIRETFGSSLELAEQTLLELGLPDTAASETVRIFREHDEKMLREAAAHVGDYAKLIELAHKGRAELESLFAQDKQS